MLNSIIDEELRIEEDDKLKKTIERKAKNLNSLLSFVGEQDLDKDAIMKKIRILIEEE